MQVNNAPRIAFIFEKYNAPDSMENVETRITMELLKTFQSTNVFSFIEGKSIQDVGMNKYSVELLESDKPISTSTCCNLLFSSILSSRADLHLLSLLDIIYFDPYFKLLFIGEFYKKFNPEKYGYTLKHSVYSFENMTPPQTAAIKAVSNLYKLLDVELPKKTPEQQELFFTQQMVKFSQSLGNFDLKIIAPISNALAFIKISKVNVKIGENIDADKELTLSLINQANSPDENVTDQLLYKLDQYRTQFQVEKIIQIIKKVFTNDQNSKDTIFIVRADFQRRDLLLKALREEFVEGDFREMQFKKSDLGNIVTTIEKEFSRTKRLV